MKIDGPETKQYQKLTEYGSVVLFWRGKRFLFHDLCDVAEKINNRKIEGGLYCTNYPQESLVSHQEG